MFPRLVKNLDGQVAIEYLDHDKVRHCVELCCVTGVHEVKDGNRPTFAAIGFSNAIGCTRHTYDELMELLYPITQEEY